MYTGILASREYSYIECLLLDVLLLSDLQVLTPEILKMNGALLQFGASVTNINPGGYDAKVAESDLPLFEFKVSCDTLFNQPL